MAAPETPDVVVVGGGPAGSIAATLLADARAPRRRARARAIPPLPHRRVAPVGDAAHPRHRRRHAADRAARLPAQARRHVPVGSPARAVELLVPRGPGRTPATPSRSCGPSSTRSCSTTRASTAPTFARSTPSTRVDTSGATPVIDGTRRDGTTFRLAPRFLVDASGQQALDRPRAGPAPLQRVLQEPGRVRLLDRRRAAARRAGQPHPLRRLRRRLVLVHPAPRRHDERRRRGRREALERRRDRRSGGYLPRTDRPLSGDRRAPARRDARLADPHDPRLLLRQLALLGAGAPHGGRRRVLHRPGLLDRRASRLARRVPRRARGGPDPARRAPRRRRHSATTRPPIAAPSTATSGSSTSSTTTTSIAIRTSGRRAPFWPMPRPIWMRAPRSSG